MAGSSDQTAGDLLDNLLSIERGFEMYLGELFKGVSVGEAQKLELKKMFFLGVMWLNQTQNYCIWPLPGRQQSYAMNKIQCEVEAFAKSLPDNGQGGLTDEPVVSSGG